MPAADDGVEPPAKRVRLTGGESGVDSNALDVSRIVKEGSSLQTSGDALQHEVAAGITTYVNPDLPGFSGILKQRYTDFQVNEILADGRVVHLESVGLSKPGKTSSEEGNSLSVSHTDDATTDGSRSGDAAAETSARQPESKVVDDSQVDENSGLTEDDKRRLTSMFGEQTSKALLSLYNFIQRNPGKRARDVRPVRTDKTTDKESRKLAHQAIRQIFNSKLDSKTTDDDIIIVTAAPTNVKPRGGFEDAGVGVKNKRGWADLGGEYLHFTLYKENRDTMEAVSFLAGQLKVSPKSLQFGGTKDRRGVTVQRVSAYRIRAEQLAAVGRKLRGAKVGDWKYLPHSVELGNIGGNEFCISLRDCRFPGDEDMSVAERLERAKQTLPEAFAKFQSEGFINYYGLQRFGSFSASTDQVGTKLLQGDLKGAIEDILSYSKDALQDSSSNGPVPGKLISSDDVARARAIYCWVFDRDGERALKILPRRFSAEYNIIQKAASGSRNDENGVRQFPNSHDFQGALMSIPRNLRMMYVHAYQSLVWNHVAGKRWELYGARVVPGDLVLVSEHRDKEPGAANAKNTTVDESGEPIVLPAADDRAVTFDDDSHERARALTEAEAGSGSYSIFDIVLPLPGYDVVYPANDTEDAYHEFMASERGGGIDPYKMRRSWKDISLSGGYRKLLARPVGGRVDFEVRKYIGKNTQLADTDLQRLEKRGNAVGLGANEGNKTAGDDSATQSDGQPRTGLDDKGADDDGVERIAVTLKMRLGTSQYATMALRELMKSGLRHFQPDYAGR